MLTNPFAQKPKRPETPQRQFEGEDAPLASEQKETQAEHFEKSPDTAKAPKVQQTSGDEQAQPAQQRPADEKSASEQELSEIEEILAEGLNEIFKQMNDQQKLEFKKEGEITAKEVQTLLNNAKIKVTELAKKITGLIKCWLEKIPGVNKFFLVQSAKIKADRLIDFKKRNQAL